LHQQTDCRDNALPLPPLHRQFRIVCYSDSSRHDYTLLPYIANRSVRQRLQRQLPLCSSAPEREQIADFFERDAHNAT
jgi:hypothetical protein